MPDPAGDLQRKLDNIERYIERELDAFAFAVEMDAKDKGENHKWQRDTGSARASTTAFTFASGDHDHNYGDPNWQQARRVGSLKYWGGPLNYHPLETPLLVSDVPGVVLTMFVGYAPDINGEQLMQDMSAAWGDHFNNLVARGIADALRS